MKRARYVLGTSVLVGVALLLCAGGALADSGTETEASRSHEIHQDVDLDEDTTLLALALGGADIEDIADIDRSVETRSDLSRDVDLDEDDVLAALVLGNGRGLRGLDDDIFVRTVVLDDDLDRDRVRLVDHDDFDDFDDLDLDWGFGTSSLFGDFDDLEDIADIDSETEVDVRSLRNFDLDTDDALLALALD